LDIQRLFDLIMPGKHPRQPLRDIVLRLLPPHPSESAMSEPTDTQTSSQKTPAKAVAIAKVRADTHPELQFEIKV